MFGRRSTSLACVCCARIVCACVCACASVRCVQGDEDEVAPVATGEALLAACTAAGGDAKPLLLFEGEHEVTPDVADKLREFLDSLLTVQVS